MTDKRKHDASFPHEKASLISDPNANDVLFGRGASNFRWPGNVKLRTLVDEMKSKYVSTTCRARKDSIAREIIEKVRTEQNGRFLIKASATGDGGDEVSGNPGPWTVADGSLVVDKVKQAIREKHYQDMKKKVESKKGIPEKSRPPTGSRNVDLDSEGDDAISSAPTKTNNTATKSSENLPGTIGTEVEAHSGRTKKKSRYSSDTQQQKVPGNRHDGTKKTSVNASELDHGETKLDRKRRRPESPRKRNSFKTHDSQNDETRNNNRGSNSFLGPSFYNADLASASVTAELIRRREQEQLTNLMGPRGLESQANSGFSSSRNGSAAQLAVVGRERPLISDHASFRPDGTSGFGGSSLSQNRRSWPFAGDSFFQSDHRLGGLETGAMSQYASLLDLTRNSLLPQHREANTPYVPAHLGGFPVGVSSLDSMQLLSQSRYASSLSRMNDPSNDPLASSREKLLDDLLQQRRLTEELLALRNRTSSDHDSANGTKQD